MHSAIPFRSMHYGYKTNHTIDMIKNSLIIIPCNVSWNWSTDYINQTARILGKTNTVICIFWIDARSIKEHILGKKKLPLFFESIEHGVIGYHAVHILPFRRFKFVYNLNIYINIKIVQWYCFFLSLRRKFTRRIVWFFDPICYPIIRAFPKKWFYLYDCIDYFRGDPILSKKERNILVKHEDALIHAANVMTVNSKALYTLHSSTRKEIYVVPQGFRLDEFKLISWQKNTSFPKDKPIIGYVGALNSRLNHRLLVELAIRLPHCQFALVGPPQEDDTALGKAYLTYAREQLFILPNVTVIFGVGKNEIKGIISQFTIGMIPYDASQDFNQYCYPMKLFEYFYMGKPVISTPIEELKRFPKFVKIGATVQEWEEHIRALLSKPWPKKYQEEQRKLAVANSWEKKVEAIGKVIRNA